MVRDTFGGVGLIDMPSARMAQDGALSLSGSFFKNNQHYNFAFQALPWLETSFRYSGLQHFEPSYAVYYDRSFAFKARLLQESDWLPALAVGVDDIVGTGVYGAEYVVASKQIGALDFTLGIGWGRKATAQTFKNPLTLLSKSFENRTVYPFDVAGSSGLSNLFHGADAGVFGGVTWATPIEGLSLIGEYSSDKYVLEAAHGNFLPANQFNAGAAYQITDSFTVGAHWLYGREFGLTLSAELGSAGSSVAGAIDSTPWDEPRMRSYDEQAAAMSALRTGKTALTASYSSGTLVDALWSVASLSNVSVSGETVIIEVIRGDLKSICQTATGLIAQYASDMSFLSVSDGRQAVQCAIPQRQAAPAYNRFLMPIGLSTVAAGPVVIDASATPLDDSKTAASRIRSDLQKQSIQVIAIDLSAGIATIYYSNGKYFHERDAVNRITRTLMAQAPLNIEKFRIISAQLNEPQREFDVMREALEREYSQTDTISVDAITATAPPLENTVLAAAIRNSFPKFYWDIFPQFRQELFDPSNPFAVQFLAGAEGSVELFRGFSLVGEAELNLYDNFNAGRPSDSVLPHVRTDFLNYFTKGKNGIGDLEADYRFRLAPNVYGLVRAGYLESMFAGFGGELLWRPEGERWSLGIDLYDVRQRAFDRLFGLRDYNAFTGHVSLYYESPWYNLRFALHAGQYLAGDHGLTLEMTRRFSTGVELGAFMTRTNASAYQFGEGSFDKGIIIRIPIGWVLPMNTQQQFNMDIRPVQRDGGQRLAGDTILYEETQRTSAGEMERAFGASWN